MAWDERRQGPSTDDTADNVVRFPRDWIGPLEELVPFGPSADRAAAVEAPTLSADAFWGEDSGSLHAVMQAPRAAADARPDVPAPVCEEAPMTVEAPMTAAETGVIRACADAHTGSPSAPGRKHRGSAALAVLLVLALPALVLAPFVGYLLGHESDVHKSAAHARERVTASRPSGATRALARTTYVGGGKAAKPSSPASRSAARAGHRSRTVRAHPRSIHAATEPVANEARSNNSTNTQPTAGVSGVPATSASVPATSVKVPAASVNAPAVTVTQTRAASGSSSVLAGTGGSSRVYSASPLPVPGGPPAP